MTPAAVWALSFAAGVLGTFVVLWIAMHLAWVKGSGLDILGISTAVHVVGAIPKVGWILALIAFFYGLTRYLGAGALEATYVLMMALLIQFAIFMLVVAQ